MNPDAAKLATADATSELGWRWARPLARLRADPERMTAVRDCWRALWLSRALVWTATLGTVLAFGFGPVRNAFDPPGLTRGFGWLGDLLAAPSARWDSDWYLVVARYGYHPDLGALTAPRAAFFPVYPLAMRALAWRGSPLILAGVLVSLLAFAPALYGIHRLASLELGAGGRLALARPARADAARLAVLLSAFAPMAYYYSAVYTESLFLALSVGVFWAARHGRWAIVGALGAVASATRNSGLTLIAPAVILYLYGPREDRLPDAVHAAGGRVARLVRSRRLTHTGALARSRPLARWLEALRPRYRLRRDALWLALMPAGLALYVLYLVLAGGSPFAPFHGEATWGRHFAGPYGGVWDGLRAAFDGARQLLSMQRHHVYFSIAAGDPFINAEHNLMAFAFLIAAIVAAVGVLRTLPAAYGAYVLAAAALPLSIPVTAQPLMSLPRFFVVLFPLNIWLASWLVARPRLRTPLLVTSAILMCVFAAQFATWHWVA